MKSLLSQASPIIFAVAFSFLNCIAACAEEPVTKFVRVPIFFLTDRNIVGDPKQTDFDFGPHRKYVGDCLHDPFLGNASVVIENVDRKPVTEALKRIGWQAVETDKKEGLISNTLFQGETHDEIAAKFYGTLKEQCELTKDKNVFVFVHGYKNSFRSAAHTAAWLSYNAERPTILYSWPSVAKLRSYSSDENNVEWSQEHFNDMICSLDDMCKDDPGIKIRLMAHSMGSRLLVRAIPILRDRHYISEFAMICPDVDSGLVKHYARRYFNPSGTAKVRLYMSRRDKALALSQIVHGGYTRLGECADSLSGILNQVMGNRPENGNEDKNEAAADDAAFRETMKLAKHRLQTIDFTEIDRGFIGHNVPAKLICSMSFSETPGSKLELIQEESGQRSKLSNTFSKITHLKDTAPHITESCLRVVRTDQQKQTPKPKK
ncbi:MAG: alpha/beta hydrolase [Candidatus Obscuribacterales bacterium]|nr:alpha/beta hydrolase [Candidatus Obscuribacterales bacterium]